MDRISSCKSERLRSEGVRGSSDCAPEALRAMARARAATFLLLTAGAFAVLACAQDAESGVRSNP